jgi:hypothetical protein
MGIKAMTNSAIVSRLKNVCTMVSICPVKLEPWSSSETASLFVVLSHPVAIHSPRSALGVGVGIGIGVGVGVGVGGAFRG